MGTNDYINEIRKLTGTGSDYAVAKLLGVSEDAINAYRKGTRAMNVDMALLIAEALDLPPLQVIADSAIEHAKTPELKRKWVRLRKTLAQSAATVLIAALAAGILPIGAERIAASMSASDYGTTHKNKYKLCDRRRKLGPRLALIFAALGLLPRPLALTPPVRGAACL